MTLAGLTGLAGVAALVCVAVMGLAIQRGATCMVAAVDELLNQRRTHRLLALLEAALWVAGGLLWAQLAGVAGSMPAGYAAGAWTVAGGALLGLGAWINGACVFGAVARLGSGEWAYAATPVGYGLGCLSAAPVLAPPPALPLAASPSPSAVAPALAVAFAVFALWRLLPAWAAPRSPGRAAWLARKVWTPHGATVVIGLSFVTTMLLAGRWAYTDVLADLAQAMDLRSAGQALRPWPVLLLLALFAGALAGGRSAGQHGQEQQHRRGPASQWVRCLIGGWVMAWGSLLIPGSNDGLILIGLPLLQPHAALALASMVVCIALAMRIAGWVQRVFAGQRPGER